MLVISIDPGVNTGMVVLETGPPLQIIYQLTTTDLSRLILDIEDYTQAEYFFLETPPINSLSPKLSHVYETIKSLYFVTECRPAEWKPLNKVHKWDKELEGTRHERDAYAMANYMLYKWEVL